ncbi:MAG TPA: signal peptidase II, partial [Nitrospiria bacterium]|nr:signal peptidase II [Nitrospiria bacterium]
MEKGINRYILFLISSGIIVFLDQLSKHIIRRTIRLHESITVINNFFSLTYIRNRGAAFGLLADRADGFRFIFFLVTSVIALFIL